MVDLVPRQKHKASITAIEFIKFTEATIIDDNDGISKHMLMPISPTFYNITIITYGNWIPAASGLKNAS